MARKPKTWGSASLASFPEVKAVFEALKEANELQRQEIEELQENYKNSIMAQWVESILDKWIYSRRNFEGNKYWKIISYYAITDNDRRYQAAMSIQDVKYVFKGYAGKEWEDGSISFFLCEDESISNFDFNRYQIIDNKKTIDDLETGLAKQLLSENISKIVKDYDFEDYF